MSKTYFIINLKKFGDIFQSAHLVSSIKNDNPHAQIHYITFKENLKAVEILNNIDEVHTIDRKKITAFFSNAIYSDGLAFNELEQALSNIKVRSDDVVINYSNDVIGSYLASFISNEEDNYKGIRFSNVNTVEYSSDAAILLNDIETSYAPTPFSFNDCYHKLLDIKQSRDGEAVLFNTDHENKAKEGLELLRLSKRTEEGNGLIVGIQICSSSLTKDIPEASLIGLISHLIEHPRTIPILLVSPDQKEKERADTLNSYFSNELISIESDFVALPSVLNNLDLLVTPDTSIKHLADLTKTLTLEVSLGESPFLKQGSIGSQNYIMSLDPSIRNFTVNGQSPETIKSNGKITGSDLFIAVTELLKVNNNTDVKELSPDVLIYRPLLLSGGHYHMPIKGEINTKFELRRFFSRVIIEKSYFDQHNKPAFLKMVDVFDESEIKSFIREEQETITLVMKDLLATLRALIQLQENQKNAGKFIHSLEILMSHAFNSSLSAVSVLDFRARLEAITSTDLKSNLGETETFLYGLKSQLKNSLSILQSAGEKREVTSKIKESSL